MLDLEIVVAIREGAPFPPSTSLRNELWAGCFLMLNADFCREVRVMITKGTLDHRSTLWIAECFFSTMRMLKKAATRAIIAERAKVSW